jgi:type VI secretion system secreted protein VgrG
MSTRRVDVELLMDVAQPYHVVSFRLTEAISLVTHAVFEIASTDDLDLEPVLTRDAEVVLRLDGLDRRHWKLRVASIAFVAARRGTLRYRVELRSHPHLLAFTQATRKWKKKTAKEIVSQVLDECRVPYRWATTRATPRRNYCVEYHETHLAFVSRMLEFEGIYFTDDPDGVMVLADASPASPFAPGAHSYELVESVGALADDVEGVHLLRRGAKICSGKATVNDFDWKKPQTNLLQSKEADRDTYLEVYDYPSGFRNAPDGEYLAKIRLEALRAPARYVAGEGTVSGFAPAHRFRFGELSGGAFAGEYLLVEVTHEHENPAYEGDVIEHGRHTVYRNSFRAIPAAVPFRPEPKTPRPTIGGHHSAMVRGPVGSEIHTDEHGRFRAQFHWDREAVGTDADSRWLRMLQESASSMFLARVGWEVNVAYIDGDPDRPIGLSRNINGVMRPAYAQPAQKNVMTIKTPSSPAKPVYGYNEIHLDDTAGAMTFDLRAEKDLMGAVRNDRVETIARHETKLVGSTFQHDVERDQTVAIGANATTVTAASYQLTVGKDRKRTVGGGESIHVAKAMDVAVEGNDTEHVGSVRLSIVGSIGLPNPVEMAQRAIQNATPTASGAAAAIGGGAAQGAYGALKGGGGLAGAASAAASGAEGGLRSMIPDPKAVLSDATGGLSEGVTMGNLLGLLCQGGIDRTGDKRMMRMVGGAWIATALGTVSTSSHLGWAEAVGGAKLTVAATGSIQQSVGGPLVVTVGGSVIRKATGAMTTSAKTTAIRVGASASFASDEKLRVMCGKSIEIDGATSLKLTQGGLAIELAPGGATVKGNLKLLAGEKIAVSGATENVTG